MQKVRDEGGVISSTLLAELIFHLSRSRSQNLAVEAVAFVEEYPLLSIANTTPEIAMLAGHLRNKYYHRTKSDMSFLDAIHLATAIQCKADTFVTTDNDFSGIEEIPVDIYR
jgi:predicted nucleic acid-binding protein